MVSLGGKDSGRDIVEFDWVEYRDRYRNASDSRRYEDRRRRDCPSDLCNGRQRKHDGTTAASGALLPSAFFTVRREGDVFLISGGGFGHGIGMSQNGANEMAKKGKNYTDILTLFFQDVTIEAGVD